MNTKFDLTKLGGRILWAIDYSGKSQRQIALAIDISPQALNKWPKTENASKEALLDFAKETGVRFTWLVSGEGEKLQSSYTLKAEAGKYELTGGPAKITHNSIEELEKRLGVSRDQNLFDSPEIVKSAVEHVFTGVPKYDIELSAGHGSQVQEESGDGFLYFRKDWIERKGLDENNLCVVYAKGHSMEPTINDGDVILIDTSEYYTHRENVDDGFVYAINLDGEAMVKRLFKKPGGGLIVRSDSPAPQYRDLQLGVEDLEYLRIIGRSIWRGGDL